MFNNDLKQVLVVYAFDTTEFANACLQRLLGRPDRKYELCRATKTLAAGTYLEIAARPKSRLQGFVSAFSVIKYRIIVALLAPFSSYSKISFGNSLMNMPSLSRFLLLHVSF